MSRLRDIIGEVLDHKQIYSNACHALLRHSGQPAVNGEILEWDTVVHKLTKNYRVAVFLLEVFMYRF